jgi:hypothetical protein
VCVLSEVQENKEGKEEGMEGEEGDYRAEGAGRRG